MYQKNKLFSIIGLAVIVSFLGWLIIESIDDSESADVTKETIADTASMSVNQGHEETKFDSKETSNIFFKNHLNAQTREHTLNGLLRRWLNEEPDGLLRYILEVKDVQLRLKFFTQTLKIWHDDDPDTLKDWMLTVRPNSVITEFCRSAVFVPQLCVQYAETSSNLHVQNSIIEYQLRHWVVVDAQAAIAWSVKAEDIFERFGVEIFRLAIELDFDTALFSLSLLGSVDSPASIEVADLIVKKLYLSHSSVESKVSSVANATLSLSDSMFKDALLLSLSPALFELGDIYSGMVLLEAMTAGPARDSLQHNFVGRLTEQQGAEAALLYVGQISNEVRKQSLMGAVVVKWAKTDIAAAHDWFKLWSKALPETTLSLAQIAIEHKNISISMELLDRIKKMPGNTLETSEYHFQITRLMYDENPESAIEYLERSLEVLTHDKEALLSYLSRSQISNSDSEKSLSK